MSQTPEQGLARRVLVFDSGVGGLSVVDAIVAACINVRIDYLADWAWLPYGLKLDEDLRARVPYLLERAAGAFAPDAVVIACNTATTIALDAARARLDIPIIGVAPPIKPAAALSKTGVIGLLATPATIARPYTDALIAEFASGVHVVRAGSAALVAAAEAKVSGESVPQAALDEAVAALFSGPEGPRLDVVALGCTHFPLLREELSIAAARPCLWLDSGDAIARRVRSVLWAQPGAAVLERASYTGEAKAGLDAFRRRGFTEFGAMSS